MLDSSFSSSYINLGIVVKHDSDGNTIMAKIV